MAAGVSAALFKQAVCLQVRSSPLLQHDTQHLGVSRAAPRSSGAEENTHGRIMNISSSNRGSETGVSYMNPFLYFE